MIDLLSFYKLDVGVSSLQRVTAMRIVGSMYLGNGVSQVGSSNAAWHWGIAWVSRSISDAGVGDAQIPDPAEQGAREVPWIQRGVLRGISVAGAQVNFSTIDQGPSSGVVFDITQMRKQPAADHVLVLIGHHDDASATADPKVWLDFNVMLGLP